MPAAASGGAQSARNVRASGAVGRAATWIAAFAGALATLVALYPGQYPFDSAVQLWQARSGLFGNGSPVAMIALWSLLLRAIGHPVALFCVNVAALWTGLALCALAQGGRASVRIVALLLVGLSPLAAIEMSHVLTDAHLAAMLVLATGCAALGLASERRGPWLAAAALLVYAGCIRHNAVVAIAPFGALVVPALLPAGNRRPFVGAIGVAALGAASIVLAVALDRALVRTPVTVWPTLALWDLAAVSVDRNVLLLPRFTHGPGLTVEELRETGAFEPTANTFLFERSRSGMRDGIIDPYTPGELRALAAAWLDAARQYPVAYVEHRMRTFWLLVGPHDASPHGVVFFELRMPFRDNPPFPPPLAPRAQAALYRYADAAQGNWTFAALPYLLLAAGAGLVGRARRSRVGGSVAVTVSASALLYALTFLPLAPSADLRYLTWPIVAGPLALAFALLPQARRARQGIR
jgi:hypothetical protein